jgi:hypothetical protein
MAYAKRALSIVLLAAGVVLVFAGLNLAVGFSPIGVISSAAAVAALLYSGAVWFGSAPPAESQAQETIFVYDRSLRIASGMRRGHPITSCVPAGMRADVEARCVAALSGASARFSCANGMSNVDFDAVPVRAADGMIVYGLLITAAKNAQPAINAAGV